MQEADLTETRNLGRTSRGEGGAGARPFVYISQGEALKDFQSMIFGGF